MALKVTDIRVGNYVDYETIPYVVDTTATASNRLVVAALYHEWKPEPCGISELKGIPIDEEWLRKNDFLQDGLFENQRIKVLGKARQLRYNTKTCRLSFETNRFLEGTPWPVRFVHQFQNACNDMGWEVEVKC